MAKAKKKKKVRKQRQQNEKLRKLKSLSAEELCAKAEAESGASQFRDSILTFRQALKKGGDGNRILPGLFLAYGARYGQLAAKHMDKEAEAVRKLGGQIFKTLPDINGDILETALVFLPVQDVLAVVKDQGENACLPPDTQKHIAHRLVAEGCLDLAAGLPKETRLYSDWPVMAAAAEKMTSGDWGDALTAMRGLGRTSPYSDMKLFAKAMTAWEAGDRTTLKKALARLDNRFPFKALRTLLGEYADHGRFRSQDAYPETAALLMGPGVHKEACRERIRKSLQPRSVNLDSLASTCIRLAGILRPEAPDKALPGLVEIIGLGLIREREDGRGLLGTFLKKTIRSAPVRRVLGLKIRAVSRDFISFATAEYLDEAEAEFPDARDLDTARAFILLRISEIIEAHQFILYEYEDELIDALEAFGLFDDILYKDIDLFRLTLIKAAIEADPDNRAAYDALFPIATPLPEHRKLMTGLLKQMTERFPQEVTACLKLSELYYRKNAFRKAEAVLQKAFDRAPHDIRVKESRALSFVISATLNLPRQKWHLVERDLDRAVEFNLPSLSVIIAEKRFLAECVQNGKFSEKDFRGLTSNFSPEQQMQCLLLFRVDIEAGYGNVNTRGLASCFNKLKKQIAGLPPADLARLLSPLDKKLEPAFPSCFYARPLLGKKGQILSRLSPDDLMSLAIPLARNHCMDIALHVLKKKQKGAEPDTRVLLSFYHTALEAIRDNRSACPELAGIIRKASEPLTERLRHISRNLAELAHLPLKERFERFEFDPHPYNGFAGPDYDDFHDDFEDEEMDQVFSDLFDLVVNKLTPEPEDLARDELYPEEVDVRRVFGKKCEPGRCRDTIFELAKSADDVVNGSHLSRPDALDKFFDNFQRLMGLVYKTGIRTTGQCRQTGREFAGAYEYTPLIIEAMDMARSVPHELLIPENQHFILGMRSGA